MFAVLRQRNFALLWFGQLASLLGDWVLFVALPFFVYDLTGSTLATGAMFIALTLPRLLLGSVAGVFVDRWDRRRTMLAADFARAALLLLLLLVRSVDQVWLVYVVAFGEAAMTQFFNPAKSALLPRLVGEDDLLAANSLNSLSESLTRLVGPALGGLLLGVLGLTSVVLLDSASFLISGLLLVLLAVDGRSGSGNAPEAVAEGVGAARTLWRDWQAGLRLVRQERTIAVLFAIVGLVMVGEGLLNVLLVPWVEGVLGGGARDFGWLMSAQAVGGIIGGVLVGRVAGLLATRYLIGLSAIADGILLLVIINRPVLVVDLIVIAIAGVPVVMLFVAVQTLLQNATADCYRGRVFGAFAAISALAQLLGMAFASTLGDRLGVVPVLSLDGVLYCCAGLLALLALRGGAVELAPPALEGRGALG